MIALQRTSSDLKLNPHIHAVFLDGVYREKGGELEFLAHGHLSTRDVALVLERTRDRMAKYLRRRGVRAPAPLAQERVLASASVSPPRAQERGPRAPPRCGGRLRLVAVVSWAR